MKKLFLVLFIWLIASLVSANALVIAWKPNPFPEKIYRYTVYYHRQATPGNIIKINTTTNRVSIETLEGGRTYIFYITSWNHNLSGDLVESPKSAPISYKVPRRP
jgi:hypothetical protein